MIGDVPNAVLTRTSAVPAAHGIWAARRGTYRVLYRLRDDAREVVVVRIDHRRDAYRPR